MVIPEVNSEEHQPSQSQTNKIYAQWIELFIRKSKLKDDMQVARKFAEIQLSNLYFSGGRIGQ